jgi:hypothetical protein
MKLCGAFKEACTAKELNIQTPGNHSYCSMSQAVFLVGGQRRLPATLKGVWIIKHNFEIFPAFYLCFG